MADEKEGKARILLASNLEHAYVTGFLTFEDVVDHIKKSLISGLVALTKLHGEKIIAAFYIHWRGKRENNVPLFMKAFVGMLPFYEAMLREVDKGAVPKIFEELIENHVISWDNLVAAFPYRSLLACLREAEQRAAEAVPQDDAAAPAEGEVAEEDMVEISTMGDPDHT